jgi:hypothetical protein
MPPRPTWEDAGRGHLGGSRHSDVQRLSGRSGAPQWAVLSARVSSMSGRISSTVHRPDNPQEGACQTATPIGAARRSLLLWWATAQVKAETVGEGTEKEQTLAHRTELDEPDASRSCSERHRTYSTALQRTVIPRSRRRGRRFNPVTPTSVPAGQRHPPKLVRPLFMPVQQRNTATYGHESEN